MRKNVTDCPLAKAVWAEWHLKNSTSSKNPSSENNDLLSLSHGDGCLPPQYFHTDIYSICSKVEWCTCINPVWSFVLSKQFQMNTVWYRMTQHWQPSFNPACSKCHIYTLSVVGILETMPTVNTSLTDYSTIHDNSSPEKADLLLEMKINVKSALQCFTATSAPHLKHRARINFKNVQV